MQHINHYYTSIHGWFQFEVLYKHMVDQCDPSIPYHFVEVGVWKGKSAVFMATEINNQGKNVKFDCIDTWLGSEEHFDKTNPSYEPLVEIPDGLFKHFLQNIRPVNHIINPIRMTSIEASKLYEDNSLDFVLIDAAHDYENVKEDIKHWFPKVKKGGVMAGDDYHYTWPGVVKAADEAFGNKIQVVGSTWYVEKI